MMAIEYTSSPVAQPAIQILMNGYGGEPLHNIFGGGSCKMKGPGTFP
ncbi:MAG: hypothetical protein WDN75_06345 [Bacteroidota bacterium]